MEQRIGKFAGRVLEKAMFAEKLSRMGSVEPMPRNKGQQIIFKRYLPYGGIDNQWISAGGSISDFINKHVITEGVTPSADSIQSTNFSAYLKQYGCLYSYTDVMRDTHEDGQDIPREMEDQASSRLILCKELMNYAELQTIANSYFAGGPGLSTTGNNNPATYVASKATVKSIAGLGDFQRISRAIQRLHGGMITSRLSSSPNYGSQSVDAGWYCYTHTDMEATFENLEDSRGNKVFKKVADYGSQTRVDPDEIGCIGRFRIITSPILTYAAGAGFDSGNAAATTVVGTGGVPLRATAGKVDLYPIIIMCKGKSGGDCFGQVALRGKTAIDTTHIPVGTKSASDPHGQRGYIGAQTWHTAKVLNSAWGAVLWSGCEYV
jgi:N4-gp56 family major capsid protein